MPKSKTKWKRLTGRVGLAWHGDVRRLVASFPVPKGYRFERIEWQGRAYTIFFVDSPPV